MTADKEGYFVDRKTSWYIIGRPGSGKTTFMKNLMADDMRETDDNGDPQGLCFIDLHGDAAPEVLALVPRNRVQDVIYYDPISPDAPAFNPLRVSGDPDDLVEDLRKLFYEFSKGSWGSRLDQLLNESFKAILYHMQKNGSMWTLKDVKTFVVNPDFRNQVLAGLDPSDREYWDYEFPDLGKGAVNPVSNKLDEFLRPKLRRIFSQPENDIDFNDIMNSGKILICRFAKGALTDDPAVLLGTVFSRAIQKQTLARERIPEPQRRNFFFYVDECQNLIASPFDSLITEGRKFHVFLTLSHHRLQQFRNNPDLRAAVFDSKVFVTFRIQEEDAPVFTKYMRRTDGMYRRRGTGEWKPISNLILYARKVLIDEYEKAQLEMERYKENNSEYAVEQYGKYEHIYADVVEAFDALRNENIGIAGLSEIVHKQYGLIPRWRDYFGDWHEEKGVRLFPDAEFRDVVFPSLDDFANLPEHHAYIRVDRASQVFEVVTPPPPAEDPTVRQEILERQRQAASARLKREQPTANEKTLTTNHVLITPPPTDRPKKKKPKADEDFLN